MRKFAVKNKYDWSLSLIIIIYLFLINLSYSQDWFDTEWYYRKQVTIDNSSNLNDLIDYQIKITLTTGNFDFNKAHVNGNDIRVTDSDGTSLIPFWIEFWDQNSADIWIKVPYIPGSNSKLIYLYYGNPTATSTSDGINTFVFFDGFENFSIKPFKNASLPLVTPTYDGSGQTIHPDVVFIPGGWNGYQYWMAHTPYPGGSSNLENPSIIASNDGINWEEPPGILNPLAPQPPGGYNNDTDMLLVNDTMMIYYNETIEGSENNLRLMISNDGITWTSPQTVIAHGDQVAPSPTIIYENGIFYLWYVRNLGCGALSSSVFLRMSSNGVNWSDPTSVNINQSERVIWHFDIQKVGTKYIMYFISYPIGSGCRNSNLYYAESLDRINWTVNDIPVLTPSAGWDNVTIYRSSFLMTGTYLRLWYSGISSVEEVRIGYTEGELSEFIGINEPYWDVSLGDVTVNSTYTHNGNYCLRLVGATTNPRLLKNISGAYSITAWVYDDLTTSVGNQTLLRSWDLGNINFPDHSIGVGISNQNSTTHYVYQSEGMQYFISGIARTQGWHKLTIRILNNTCDLLIDDQPVASLNVLNEQNIYRFTLDGRSQGNSWFDDVYVRQLNSSEPDVIVSLEDQSLPVVLSVFTGKLISNGIRLEWITESEINNVGFILQRSDSISGNYLEIASYLSDERLRGKINSNIRSHYYFDDKNTSPEKYYFYKLIDVDINGEKNIHGPIKVKTEKILLDYNFYPAYPNPFNPKTNLKFNLPNGSDENRKVKISIYNLLGEKIKTLINDKLPAGEYEVSWSGESDQGAVVAGGIYFIIVQTEDYQHVEKLVFAK